MATSGTTTFTLDFVEAIEEAFERAGVENRVGYDMRSARRSINLLFAEWANRGINLWTVEERTQALTPLVGEYTLDSDIVDIIETMVQVPNTTQVTRYNLSRISVSTYAGHTNPTITGRPTEVYIDRQRVAPIVKLWPLPNIAGYTLVYWILRRIEDAGAFTNNGDFPFRFLPAFIAGLAYYIAEKRQQADPALIQRLKLAYDEAWQLAADEDRDRSTLSIVPRSSSYRTGSR